MRFSQNVVELLPEFVHRIEFKPLIQPIYLYILTAIFFFGTILTAIRLGSSPHQYDTAWAATLEQQNETITQFASQSGVQYLIILLSSLAILLIVDKWLYRVFR